MNRASSIFPINRWLEPAFCLAIAALIAWSLFYLNTYHHLPQPYFYVSQDSFMDWFNTAHFAHNPGAYGTWGSIYPPLSFVVLKLLSNGACYTVDELSSRDCDWYGLASIFVIFFANAVLILKTYLKTDRATAMPRSFALSFGYPMTFALERGNIVILCFTCILLAYGPLLRSARLRWFFAACAINFKVYLFGTPFAQLLRRRWRWFEGAMIMTIFVYLVTFMIFGDGTPLELDNNIKQFSTLTEAATPLDLWNAITYFPAISLLHSSFPMPTILGSRVTDGLIVSLPLAIHTAQGMILLAAMAAWVRPEVVSPHRIVFLSIAMALISSEAGSYTQPFLILFIFMERWKGTGRKCAIVAAYLLCIPHDLMTVYNVPSITTTGFMSRTSIIAEYSVGIMPLIRPAIVLVMCSAIALVTIADVWRDIRLQGWKTRWRFRADIRLLAGAGTAAPPPGFQRQDISVTGSVN